MSLNVTIDIM